MLDKQSLTLWLNFSVRQEEGFLLAGGMAPAGLSAAQTVLLPAHLPVLREGNKKPSTFHPLPGNAKHPLGESPPTGPTYNTRCLWSDPGNRNGPGLQRAVWGWALPSQAWKVDTCMKSKPDTLAFALSHHLTQLCSSRSFKHHTCWEWGHSPLVDQFKHCRIEKGVNGYTGNSEIHLPPPPPQLPTTPRNTKKHWN